MDRDHDIIELFDDEVVDDADADDRGDLDEPTVTDDDEDLLALADEATARNAVAVAPVPDGSVVLQYPSRDFPPPPVFRLRVPDGWLAVPVPEAQMAVRRPEPVEGFHPNVLVRVRRTPARATVADDLRRLTAIDDAPEGMEVLADEVRTDLATPARSVKVRFAGPEGLTLEARHLMVYVPATEHMANVVSVVGTWPHTADPALGLEVETAVASFRLLLPAG